MESVPCFLLLIMVTAMNASRGTMTQTVFMDGRDNGPAKTRLGCARLRLDRLFPQGKVNTLLKSLLRPCGLTLGPNRAISEPYRVKRKANEARASSDLGYSCADARGSKRPS